MHSLPQRREMPLSRCLPHTHTRRHTRAPALAHTHALTCSAPPSAILLYKYLHISMYTYVSLPFDCSSFSSLSLICTHTHTHTHTHKQPQRSPMSYSPNISPISAPAPRQDGVRSPQNPYWQTKDIEPPLPSQWRQVPPPQPVSLSCVCMCECV